MSETRVSKWSSDERIDASTILKNVYQVDSVESYYQFEDCLQKLGELPNKLLVDLFLDGLHYDIRNDVKRGRPLDLQEALAKAKVQEYRWQQCRYHEQDATIRELRRLKQLGSVQEYQDQFEKLLSKVGTLSAEFVVNCFLNGLQRDVHEFVRAQKPYTWYDASFLAKLQEIRLTWKTENDVLIGKMAMEAEALNQKTKVMVSEDSIVDDFVPDAEVLVLPSSHKLDEEKILIREGMSSMREVDKLFVSDIHGSVAGNHIISRGASQNTVSGDEKWLVKEPIKAASRKTSIIGKWLYSKDFLNPSNSRQQTITDISANVCEAKSVIEEGNVNILVGLARSMNGIVVEEPNELSNSIQMHPTSVELLEYVLAKFYNGSASTSVWSTWNSRSNIEYIIARHSTIQLSGQG